MTRHALCLIVLLPALLAGCGKGGGAGSPAASQPRAAASAPTLLLAPEDLRTVALTDRAQGPVITGSIQPERRADLRAEVSSVVLTVLKDNGEAVRRGDLLVRLDDTAIRDSLTSADESVRALNQAFDQAERQVQRLKTLQAQGMTSLQALEDAEVRRNNAQSDLVAARARVVSARQMLQRTEVRAPFDGVVSGRLVSAGDTAQVGKELVKVIDPRSMRLEGLVSADRLHELKVGQKVAFRINGYPQGEFAGTVRRIDAAGGELLVGFEFTDPQAVLRDIPYVLQPRFNRRRYVRVQVDEAVAVDLAAADLALPGWLRQIGVGGAAVAVALDVAGRLGRGDLVEMRPSGGGRQRFLRTAAGLVLRPGRRRMCAAGHCPGAGGGHGDRCRTGGDGLWRHLRCVGRPSWRERKLTVTA